MIHLVDIGIIHENVHRVMEPEGMDLRMSQGGRGMHSNAWVLFLFCWVGTHVLLYIRYYIKSDTKDTIQLLKQKLESRRKR